MNCVLLTRILAAGAAVAMVCCGCENQVVCTAEARPSLRIAVVDAAGRPACGATVVVRDGPLAATLQEDPNRDCTHTGVSERRGTYDIEVAKGARKASLDDVKVSADECHVRTRAATVRLPG